MFSRIISGEDRLSRDIFLLDIDKFKNKTALIKPFYDIKGIKNKLSIISYYKNFLLDIYMGFRLRDNLT